VVVATEQPVEVSPMSDATMPLGDGGEWLSGAWLAENRRLALAVTRALGVADQVALSGMAGAPADPGAAWASHATLGGRRVPFLDATAANDPESLSRLVADFQAFANRSAGNTSDEADDPNRLIVVFNHRHDRAERLRVFASDSPCFSGAPSVIITGARPGWSLRCAVLRARGDRRVEFASIPHLARALELALGSAKGVIFCGNTRGFDVRAVLGAGLSHG
jgi:hypothetical protein